MSSTIWTRCGGKARVRRLAVRAWRVVEAQHAFATRKLVDSANEQALLEALIEGAKPPLPADPEFAGLHYLLATPFRYPPLPHGSRFGRREERGLWYGAAAVATALAGTAYYTLLFLDGPRSDLGPLTREHSAYRVDVVSAHGADLCAPPFAAHAARIRDPVSYGATQALGSAMRADGVEAFRYPSARDPAHGPAVGVLTPRAFASRAPHGAFQTWHCTATREAVVFRRRFGVGAAQEAAFPRGTFLVDGKLPAPAM